MATATHPIHDALESAIQHLKSDDGYEIIANGEKWAFLLESVLTASGMGDNEVAEAMRTIETLGRA